MINESNQKSAEFSDSPCNAEARARISLGSSNERIYQLVSSTIRGLHRERGTLVDVGCGTGELRRYISDAIDIYIGSDIVRYDGLPAEVVFKPVNLDTGSVDLPDGEADVVACVETIEHVENPRALFRELSRLARPGGLIVVTTPNQLSLLNKLCFALKDQFAAFQEGPGLYPSHISALLPVDLVRMAQENHLVDFAISYPGGGRIPGTARHWPRRLNGKSYSDNVLLSARKSR